MFDKYDEFMAVFEENLLDKIDNHNFEIKGSIQVIRNILENKFNAILPVILENDNQLIYSSISKYLNAKRDYNLILNVCKSRIKTSFDIKSLNIDDSKMNLDKKSMEFLASKLELEKTCQKYATALCILTYNGTITKEILEFLVNFGYDGTYGNDNLKLMFELFVKNIDNENKLISLRNCNKVIVNKINNSTNEIFQKEIDSKNKQLKKLQEEINRLQILVDHYKKQLETPKTYTKSNMSNNFHIYGK